MVGIYDYTHIAAHAMSCDRDVLRIGVVFGLQQVNESAETVWGPSLVFGDWRRY